MRVGDKGRVVVPAEIRDHRGWAEGTVLIAIESERGVLLMSRDEARALLREQLEGRDLVAELLAERAAEARRDDVGSL
jgi:AbrB family looped-hinge helix DNA binding protein